MRIFKILGRDERGVTSIEYATMAAAIGLALMAALPLMRSAMTEVYNPLTASLDKFNKQITRRIAAKEGLPAAPRPRPTRMAGATGEAAQQEARPQAVRATGRLERIMTGSLRKGPAVSGGESSTGSQKTTDAPAREMAHRALRLRPSIYED